MEKTLEELAEHVSGRVRGDGRVTVSGLAPIREAQPNQITFLDSPKYIPALAETGAAAVITDREVATEKPLLIVDNPRLAMIRIIELFRPPRTHQPGVHPMAAVDETARVDETASVYPQAFVGRNSVIGPSSIIMAGAVIDDDVEIGKGCLIYPNVSILQGSRIGDRVIIHSGTVIGSDGYGYVQDGGRHVKIPQVGCVQIDDDVEIGANVTVDRATMGRTWIKRGVKIDNLVQVAHNVVVGEDTLLISQVGISGSTEIGRNVVLAGQVGVAGHIKIGDRVMVGGQSGLHRDVEDGAVLSGSPAIPHRQWLRVSGYTAKLPDMAKQLAKLEAKLQELEEKIAGGRG